MILQLQYIGDAEKREERRNKRQQVYRNGIILFSFFTSGYIICQASSFDDRNVYLKFLQLTYVIILKIALMQALINYAENEEQNMKCDASKVIVRTPEKFAGSLCNLNI